ncbi:MAG: radical SAM/Cys-rich domain protein [Thermodesulfobacteriota bacterium]|nr:MAG: radical SAM/Cys-rich domain protein [Thermodesulfobacteriota bacterium]
MSQVTVLRPREIPQDRVDEAKYNFNKALSEKNIDLPPQNIETLQINITKLCNQTCLHCHVDASPKRKEQMDLESVDRCLEILSSNKSIKNLDLTGGAPELNPHFDYLVKEATKLDKHVMVRHNLTVTIDGNPVTGETKEYLPEFYAENRVEVISSLPYYQEYFTDKQRGKGVFEKSIESILLLNEQGFGKQGTSLELNFVYNPVGAFLPASQENLETDFKRELHKKYGIEFNNLFVITNMPINRFKQQLKRLGAYDEYMEKLVKAFNPSAAQGVMCRSLISVSHDGRIYDCDFNQMLEMDVIIDHEPMTIFNFDYEKLVNRRIMFGSHCFGCTAGSGSSCGGATT